MNSAIRSSSYRGRALQLLIFGFCLIVIASCERDAPPPEVRDRNVLLVVLDTTRADAVEGYGGRNVYTPTLRKLAAEGALFQNARTTSAWTLPAHGSLFTGLFPSRHGAHAEGSGLDSSLVTLPDLLGRTHDSAGFSENPHIVEARGFARGFDHFEETWREQASHAKPPPTEERIATWLSGRDETKPFFLFVNLMTPHLPYLPTLDHQERLVPRLDAKIIDNFRSVEEGHARMQIMGQLGFKRLEFSILRALYHADVATADTRLQNILDLLGGDAVLDNTLVVVVGDHGENIGDHGLMEHQFCLYESLLRVPLIIRLPGEFAPGSNRDEPVQLVDVMPTVLDALDWPADSRPLSQGQSLLGSPSEHSRPVYAELMRPTGQEPLYHAIDPEFEFAPYMRRLKSIQVDNLKLITSEDGERELYNLLADPGELSNLASKQPDDVARLEAQLLDWSGAWNPAETPPLELDTQTKDALRELGYGK
ncbi:MAG: sulfatase [Myxococcales bacterium]